MVKQAERIKRIHDLVRLRATGSPSELALRLGISERQLYNLLDLMKELGAPLYFDFSLGSYAYKYKVKWNYRFESSYEASLS